MGDPGDGHAPEVVVKGAGHDSTVGLVGVQYSRVAGAQLHGGGRLPPLGEAVETGQFVDPAGRAQLGEQPAPAHGLELARVTDERQPPAVPLGEVDETVQGRGADHAGLVDDKHRAGREPVGLERSAVGPVPFVEQLGDGVGGHAGVSVQDTGGLGRRGDAEHGPVPRRQVVDGAFQHGGLAGAGRSHHDDEAVGAGGGGGGVGLQDVKAGPDDRR